MPDFKEKIVNIGEFAQKKPPIIWYCNCGCGEFEIYQAGYVRCLSCNCPIPIEIMFPTEV